MSVGVGRNADLDLCDLKSPSSQESGLGTMLASDVSLGSLEELSEGVHLQLNTHMDHTRLLQYELDLLRAQLAEKNRLISSQQISIKQLQDALNANQRELNDFRRIAETELTCKSETINILQSDLADCQQQYAECFQQVVNQDRVLAELRDEDAILLQKVTYLESQLHKTGQDASTQTGSYIQPPLYGQRMVDPSTVSFSRSSAFPQTSSAFLRPDNQRVDRSARRAVHSMMELPERSMCKSPSPVGFRSSLGSKEDYQNTKSNDKFVTVDMFQDLLTEIRLLQLQGRPTSVPPPPPPAPQQPNHRHPVSAPKNNDETIELWNTITDEKQNRLQLEHSIRLLEIDLMDIRNQVQSCNARIASNQTNKCQGCTCLSKSHCCSPAATSNCCPCPVPAGASTLYTLV